MRKRDEMWKAVIVLFVIFLTMVFTVMEMGKNAEKVGESTEAVPSETTTSCTLSTDTTTIFTTENSASGTVTSSTSAQTTYETTSVTEPVTEAPVTEPVTNAVEETQPETQANEDEKPATEEAKPEPQPEPTPEPVEEFLVYKPSTYYIHKNTCRWNKDDAYRIDDVTGLEARLCTECRPQCEGYTKYIPPVEETPSPDGMTYVGYFGRVTYYPATAYYDGVCGGSDRTLLGYGDYGNGIRGSVASRSLWSTYGYNYNGRTTVYLEFPGYESMNGYYYVDDCCAYYGVIDVFVWSDYACPFYGAGVITANCWI